MDRLMDTASPEQIAELARASGAASVAFTYNDPVIFAEYAMDVADACHGLGLHSVAVTAGYVHAGPRREFYAKMDAANVDLKGFTEKFYFQQTGAHLAPVLDTLQYLRHQTGTWLEITTLLIPGHNDSSGEIEAMTRWIADQLGPAVPLHFTAFHPDYKMMDVAPTPPATLTRARSIAIGAGLHHVYTGNVHDVEGGTTFCPGCRRALVWRDWHVVLDCEVDARGICPYCGMPIPGRFGTFKRGFGRRRIPVQVANVSDDPGGMGLR
jgi:pyruvate formate lyase activating enzyme